MRSVPILFWWSLGCPRGTALPSDRGASELSEALPVDPGVRRGVLANGLSWFVEPNSEPEDRVVLRLAVDAGSALEDPDQLGLAHVVEHMAFNGSAHFPGNELVRYLESVGAQFGPHLNAHTSFDETVYKLTVPSDDPAIVEKAFLVLGDWAQGVAFDPAEVEAERGVVLEEWRQRLGVQGRMSDLLVPLELHGSRYAERLPIGTEDSLRTFDPAALVRFYRDWYRPDLMAVVVAGDLDPERAEALIRRHFEGMPAPEAPRERERFPLPDHDQTLYGIFADPEMTRHSLSVTALVDDHPSDTVGGYRLGLMDSVGLAILQERLDTLARSEDPPFLYAGVGRSRTVGGRATWSLQAAVEEGGLERAWEALLAEVERLRRHGVRPGELDRARADLLSRYDTLLAERDQEHSASAADEIVRHFLVGESMPGIDVEAELARRFVPAFTLGDLSAWGRSVLPPRSRVVSVAMPRKEGLEVPTEARLAEIEARVLASELPPLPEEEALPPLLPREPTPGAVVSRDDRHLPATGFQGLVLSNGIRVWVRETDFKNDEVLFQGFSPGGESLIADEDLVTARLLLATLDRSGLGQLDREGLDRWLSGKVAGASLQLDASFERVSGASSPEDLAVALQLLHASLAAPRFDPVGFQGVLDRQRSGLADRHLDPNAAFADAWTRLLWTDPRVQPWTVETLAQARLDRMSSLHADRFGDLGDLQLVLVGNLPEDTEALLERWVGSLPTGGRTEAARDRGERPREGRLETIVERGLEARSRVRIEWHGPFEPTLEARFRLYLLGDVLTVLLRETLREELGGVYGVGVRADDGFAPYGSYSVSVEFTCDPDRVSELIRAADQVVESVRREGPPERVVALAKEKRLRAREEDLRTNRWWLNVFAQSLQRGVDPAEILDLERWLAPIDVGTTRDTARALLDDGRRAQAVLLPAPGPTPAGSAPVGGSAPGDHADLQR